MIFRICPNENNTLRYANYKIMFMQMSCQIPDLVSHENAWQRETESGHAHSSQSPLGEGVVPR